MDYQLYGRTVEIGAGMENYNNIKLEIDKIWHRCEQEFENRFYKEYSNMDEAIKDVRTLCYGYIDDGIKWGISFLNKNGVHKFSEDSFFETYVKENGTAYPLLKNADEIEEKYIEIISTQEEMEQYRRERKANRGRMEGGGFGLEGAVKGAAMAGTVNLASGLAHSTVNLVGNAISSAEAASQKKKLFQNPLTIEKYMDGIENSLELLTLDISSALTENSDFEVVAFGKNNEAGTAEAASYISNIQKGYIKDEEVLDYCIKAVEANPCCNDAYKLMLERYGDENGELQTLSEHFGVSVVSAYKAKEIKQGLSAINYYEEKEMEQGVSDFFAWASQYGVDKEQYEQAFGEIRKLSEVQSKTVDGEEYDTKEEAEEEKGNILAFLDKVASTSGNDVDDVKGLISELESSAVKSKKKYIDYLHKELEKEDVRFRSVKNTLYDNREVAKQARDDALLLDELFKERAVSSKNEIEERLEKVAELKTEDLRELYTDYLKLCLQIWEEQESVDKEVLQRDFALRKEFAEVFYAEFLRNKKAQHIKAVAQEYEDWYNALSERYATIGGQVYTPQEADKAYFKMVDHARSYLQYITEKNADKKSIFSKIKTGVTGIVYKNYEPEYNELTGNGTRIIPSDDTKADAVSVAELASVSEKSFAAFVEEVKEKYGRMENSGAIEEASLNAKPLYAETPSVDPKAIHQIISEVCPSVELSAISEHLPKAEAENYAKEIEAVGGKEKGSNVEYEKVTLISIGDDREKIAAIVKEYTSFDDGKVNELLQSVPVVIFDRVNAEIGDMFFLDISAAGGEADIEMENKKTAPKEESTEDSIAKLNKTGPKLNVTLKSVGNNADAVIDALVEFGKLDRSEAEKLVSSAPITVKRKMPAGDATWLRLKLESAGAKVDF